MASITNINAGKSQASEAWFPVMDPICLTDVCKDDLENWSTHKKDEDYLTVHQDGPFPLSDGQPLSSKRVRDSICIYKERMAGHDHKTPPKLVKFHTTCFANTTPSTEQLSQKLKAYRRRLISKSSQGTSQKLLDLEVELTAILDVVQQKLREQVITTSENSSPSKTSISSRASDLSHKLARKVTKSFSSSISSTASGNKTTSRPKDISRASWASATTSKLADKVRGLIEKSHQPTRSNSIESDGSFDSVYSGTSIESVDTKHSIKPISSNNARFSPITFDEVIWKPSSVKKMASAESLRNKLRCSSRGSQDLSPPSPKSQSQSRLEVDLRRNSVANSASVYSRSLSGENLYYGEEI
jgi:hypothetical protein